MHRLAESSDRIQIENRGSTYEGRTILLLTITSPENHSRIEEIKSNHIALTESGADQISIEAPFFGKNVQSMLKLGRAQGVAMAAGLSREIPITEYSPKKIKMSITGNGNATKEQVAKMLQSLSLIKEIPKNLDATDGLAAAVCHFYNQGKPQISKSYTGWKAFINQNPKKIKTS